MCALVRGDFYERNGRLYVALRAKVTKAKKKAILPVPEPVAKRLRPKLARLAATDRLWPGYGARMLRPDLGEAEIPYADENGKELPRVRHRPRLLEEAGNANGCTGHQLEVLAQLLDRGDPSALPSTQAQREGFLARTRLETESGLSGLPPRNTPRPTRPLSM